MSTVNVLDIVDDNTNNDKKIDVDLPPIASTDLTDSSNLVRLLDSPELTDLTLDGSMKTAGDIICNGNIIDNNGNITINIPSAVFDYPTLHFQVDGTDRMLLSTDRVFPFNTYIQATDGALNLSARSTNLSLLASGIPTITTPVTNVTNFLCLDGPFDTVFRKRADIVDFTTAQTMSSKTLVTPNINTNLALVATNRYTITPVNPAANRIYSVQDIGANGSFMMTDGVYYNATLNQGVAPTLGYKQKIFRGTSSTTSGVAVFNVTTDGLASPGAAIFTSLSTCTIQATAISNTTSAIVVPLCAIKAITTTQITVNVVNGLTAVLASNTLTFVPNGTVVHLVVIGV